MLRYRLFGNTGLRVSEICLGTMSFGDAWGFGADEPTSHAVLDRFTELGGNFLDSANMYHGGQTERIIGNWLTAVKAVDDASHHSAPESVLSVVALYSAGASLTRVCGFVIAKYIVNMQPATVSDGIAMTNHTQGF